MNAPLEIGRHLYRIAAHAPLVGAEEIGFKAHGLLRLARLGLKVPDAVVLGTSACKAYFVDAKAFREPLKEALAEAVADIEQASGLGFGSPRRPLLLAVRSGAPVSMPGMMDTVLDIGLCDASLRGLLRLTGNPRLAWDSYRRLVQAFAEIVHGADPAPFRERLAARLERERAASPRELDYKALSEATADFLAIYAERVGSAFPQDPQEQLQTAAAAVLASWNSERARQYRRLHHISADMVTALTLQRMVFGNAGGTSGAGVGFTRDPTTGENRLYVDFLFNSQGEDLVSGRAGAGDAEQFARVLPGVSTQLAEARRSLEQEFRDAIEFEFTVQNGQLFMLQARSGKRTPWAALRIAVEQADTGLISREEALERMSGFDPGSIRRTRLRDREGLQLLAHGVSAGLGVAAGPLALDAASVKRLSRKGRLAILVREEMSTEDIAGIAGAGGVLTARGSRTAHAAVVARQLGKPCVVGCAELSIDLPARTARLGSSILAEGEELCIDGESGEVYSGRPHLSSERPEELIRRLEAWRDPSG